MKAATAGRATAQARGQRRRAPRDVRARETEHARKVARIAQQLRERQSTAPVSLRKRAVAHQVPKAGDLRRGDEKVDLSDLDRIIEIDPQRRICVAEPGVTYVDLVQATLAHGLVPKCVPELKTITIGGAVSGCSLESMSYRFGGMHDSCLEYELITGTGEVLTCSPEGEESLLFQMVHGSFGTLGLLTKLTFELIPAKPFVKMRYETHRTLAEYQAAIWRVYQGERPDVDFMDGIIHGPDEYVLSLGQFVDEAPYTTSYEWMRIYYLSTKQRSEDYLTTPDYFFRYDRGVTNVFPKSFVGRLLLGKVAGSAAVLRAAEKLNFLLPRKNPTIILDVFLPFSKVTEFLEWYGEEFRYFPLWCVPYKRVRKYEWMADELFERNDDELWVDLAIYGMKQKGDKNYHKLMEEKLQELGGIKTLISHNYYSEDEFWRSWNKRNYDQVKARTDPNNVFRDLYTKTCKAAMGIAA